MVNSKIDFFRCLLPLKNQRKKEFSEQIDRARLEVMNSLSAASLESYQRAYPFLIKLHMLEELSKGFSINSSDGKTHSTPFFFSFFF